MNISKNILKGFAAVTMLCMVGAVFATPVALGDIGWYLGRTAGYGAGHYIGEKVANNEYVAQGTGYLGSRIGGRIGWEVGAEIGASIGALAGPEGAIVGAVAGAL